MPCPLFSVRRRVFPFLVPVKAGDGSAHCPMVLERKSAALADAGPIISYSTPEERMITFRRSPEEPDSIRWPSAARPIETPRLGNQRKTQPAADRRGFSGHGAAEPGAEILARNPHEKIDDPRDPRGFQGGKGETRAGENKEQGQNRRGKARGGFEGLLFSPAVDISRAHHHAGEQWRDLPDIADPGEKQQKYQNTAEPSLAAALRAVGDQMEQYAAQGTQQYADEIIQHREKNRFGTQPTGAFHSGKAGSGDAERRSAQQHRPAQQSGAVCPQIGPLPCIGGWSSGWRPVRSRIRLHRAGEKRKQSSQRVPKTQRRSALRRQVIQTG